MLCTAFAYAMSLRLVINAIDDLLSKEDQIDIAWKSDRIKVLQPILQAAQTAGRSVVITSDHGHVIQHTTVYRANKEKGGEEQNEKPVRKNSKSQVKE